ncbi:cell wall hydrolase [Desulfotomaculum copahuensis]|uniref:Cell wall hydrolase SleB domain-containing protein n=1 Tax=Desulfotomaculum copahuensis TaxID=1838280 RepID=A0A1B7LDL0_9FIRM|nr:cell wall hydrolase [Desulfotomaculum copahuensis]OAT81184.1 hypothetical protein A6M21_11645 [Desulfotomaculum copahuensis]
MAFFLWFKRKENKPALLTGMAALALLVISLAVLPGAWGATTGNEQAATRKPAVITAHDAASPAPEVSRGGTVNRDDVYLMARVIEGEAANEPFTGKVAVGAVIMNRTRSPQFPHTIAGVIYQSDAFQAVSNGQYDRPLTTGAVQAARDAIDGQDPTGGALYYWNPAKAASPWIWSRPIIARIGNHVFAR